jgi:hypothetical protein
MADDIADITERLRRAAPFMRASGKAGIVGQHAETAEEAAEEITRLRRQNQELREALKPFAAIVPSSLYPDDGSESEEYFLCCGTADDVGISNGPDFTGADLARARAALASQEATGADEIPDRQS